MNKKRHQQQLNVNIRFCSGYEVEGLEKIPTEGPIMIVFYHGALPIDFYYLFAKVWLYRNRRVRVVADNFVFKIPGSFVRFFFLKFCLFS